jgi:hypothetical protein
MEKHFYKKIYIITLCNFWHRSKSWPTTQDIQKLATEELWFFRYCRSRVFTFVFFMLKLTEISSDKNIKSCGILHHESNKIGFAFFCFICDFLHNLQESAKQQYYLRFTFATRPLTRFPDWQICPRFPKNTLEIIDSLQCRPWHGGWRGRPEFRRAGGALGRGRGGEELGDHLGPSCAWLRGGEAGGKGARRRSRVACAWSSAPASSRPGYHAGGGAGSSRT